MEGIMSEYLDRPARSEAEARAAYELALLKAQLAQAQKARTIHQKQLDGCAADIAYLERAIAAAEAGR